MKHLKNTVMAHQKQKIEKMTIHLCESYDTRKTCVTSIIFPKKKKRLVTNSR